MGIEPTFEAWEAPVLPLNYTRAVRDFRHSTVGWFTESPSPGSGMGMLISLPGIGPSLVLAQEPEDIRLCRGLQVEHPVEAHDIRRAGPLPGHPCPCSLQGIPLHRGAQMGHAVAGTDAVLFTQACQR